MSPKHIKLRLFYSLSILLFTGTMLASNAAAATLGQDDLNSIYNDNVWYQAVVGTNTGQSACLPNLTGSNQTQQAWNFFISQTNPSLTPIQVAAILGNFQEESGVDPQRVQGDGDSPNDPLDGETGWGIAQWTSLNRQNNLQNYADSQGQSVDSLAVQLAFAWQEAGSGGMLDTLKNIQDLQTAVDYWMNSYERPAVDSEHEDVRFADAQWFLIQYGSTGSAGSTDETAPPVTGSGCSGGGGGGSQTGTGSGPVDEGTNAQLAQKLLNYRKTGQYQCDNPGDCTDLEYMVEGKALSSEPNTACKVDTLDSRVLKLLLYLIENGGFKIGTFAMCGDHSDDGLGGHSGGLAVDISTVDGANLGLDTSDAGAEGLKMDQFLNSSLPTALKLDQQISWGYGGHYDAAMAATQQYNGQLCGSSCVTIYTQAIEDEHTNHIHAGY
ncbi:MAG TPA: phage tail tip lysozyme [Candidatus Saccharimonadales bacterium]|nr:phage tail tip lysozyme [Candidatus Saccharimonadales bacterium]